MSVVALAFAVLHLPGLSGADAAKMMVTAGLCSVIYSIAFLRSRTLWAAVGLHMGMNVVLHSVLGDGGQGPSLWKIVFGNTSSLPYDAGFASFVLAALITIAALMCLWPRQASTGTVSVATS